MRASRGSLGRVILITVLAGSAGACAAAVGAAAGAAGVIAYTERGAETELDAGVSQIATATEAVFAEREIQLTGRDEETDASRIELRGEQEDTEITVTIERRSEGLTRVRVIAREGVVDYDRERAREILRGIVARM